MKIQADNVTSISSMEMEQHAMGLDLSRMSYIINMLTDAYKNPILAVIREYAANALDAQRQAGNSDPIVVTLPTALAPNLIVQDQGIGLTLDEIINIYAQYGSSTKSEDNDMIGGYGIGSKSAFAVAAHFTVTAIKDGVESQVIFARTAEGGTVNVLRSEETDKPNGVTVSVPVEGDYNNYRIEAEKLFSFWSKNDVTVLGADISYIEDTYTEIADGIWTAPHTSQGYSYGLEGVITLRVGSIPYALDHSDIDFFEQYDFAQKLARTANIKVVFDVPIGSVDIPAHREKILLNNLARQQVNSAIALAKAELATYYTREIANAKNRVAATRIYLENKNSIEAFTDAPMYKGKPLKLVPTKDKSAIVGSELDGAGKKVTLLDGRNSTSHLWLNPKVPVIIIDKGDAKLEKGKHKPNRWSAEVDVSGEFFALVDGRKGKVRRNMSAFMRSLIKDNVFKDIETSHYSKGKFLYVYKHELGRDTAVLAHPHKVYTIEQIQEIAKAYQDANRKQRVTSGGGVASAAFTYTVSDIEGVRSNKTVAEIVAYKNILYVENDDRWSVDRALNQIKSFADKNTIVILPTRTQKTEAMQNRIKRADANKQATFCTTWVREQATKAANKGMSDSVAMAVQLRSSETWKRVIEPLATNLDLITSDTFKAKVKSIHDTISAVDNKDIRKWQEIARLSDGSDNRTKTAWDDLLAEYPVIKVFSSHIGYLRITDETHKDTLAAFAEVINALDATQAGDKD